MQALNLFKSIQKQVSFYEEGTKPKHCVILMGDSQSGKSTLRKLWLGTKLKREDDQYGGVKLVPDGELSKSTKKSEDQESSLEFFYQQKDGVAILDGI